MNRVYEIGEGRPARKRRSAMLLVDLVLVIYLLALAVALIVSGPITQSVGKALGLGASAALARRIAKWLMLVIIVIVAVFVRINPTRSNPRSSGSFSARVTSARARTTALYTLGAVDASWVARFAHLV